MIFKKTKQLFVQMSPRLPKVEAFVIDSFVTHVSCDIETKLNILKNIHMHAKYSLENEQNVKSRSVHILLFINRCSFLRWREVEEEGSGWHIGKFCGNQPLF